MRESELQGPEISRRALLRAAGTVVLFGSGASLLGACSGSADGPRPVAAPANGIATTLYRQEGCSCCVSYADYLGENGFAVEVTTVDDLAPIRERHGIPDDAVGCHTSLIDGYVVEGHVPVEAIDRLLSARTDLDGISVVGMPGNSPGMGDPNGEPLDVLSFSAGRVSEFMSVTTF